MGYTVGGTHTEDACFVCLWLRVQFKQTLLINSCFLPTPKCAEKAERNQTIYMIHFFDGEGDEPVEDPEKEDEMPAPAPMGGSMDEPMTHGDPVA
jgi:hypothetical protein